LATAGSASAEMGINDLFSCCSPRGLVREARIGFFQDRDLSPLGTTSGSLRRSLGPPLLAGLHCRDRRPAVRHRSGEQVSLPFADRRQSSYKPSTRLYSFLVRPSQPLHCRVWPEAPVTGTQAWASKDLHTRRALASWECHSGSSAPGSPGGASPHTACAHPGIRGAVLPSSP